MGTGFDEQRQPDLADVDVEASEDVSRLKARRDPILADRAPGSTDDRDLVDQDPLTRHYVEALDRPATAPSRVPAR